MFDALPFLSPLKKVNMYIYISSEEKKEKSLVHSDNIFSLHLFFCNWNNYIIQSSGLHSHTEQRYQIRVLPLLAILITHVLPP